MIRITNSGARDFGQNPARLESLPHWEFIAVVEGRCGVVSESGEKQPMRRRTLWIFPPHHVHGWHGDTCGCVVVAFRTDTVPVQILAVMPIAGYFEHALNSLEHREVQELNEAVTPDFHRHNILNELRFDRAIVHLSLLALAGTAAGPSSRADQRMAQTVEIAINWFRRHLIQQPSVRDVARAAGVSSNNLRRYFVAVLNKRPLQVMTDIQLEVAAQMLEQSTLKVDCIASTAGFASARAFARVFRAHKAVSPAHWRLRAQSGMILPDGNASCVASVKA